MDYTGNYRDKHDSPAYQAAIKRRIKRNALIGNFRRMPPEVRALADHLDARQTEKFNRTERQRMLDSYEPYPDDMTPEEYVDSWIPSWAGPEQHQCSHAQLIIDCADWKDFGDKLVASWIVFGKLSEKQMEWVKKLPKKNQERDQAFIDAQEARKGSEYIGEIGERLRDLSLTVTFETRIETDFGASKLVKFVDADGNEFGTFGSGNSVWILEKGDEVILTGTVKKHETYKEIKQTMLSRCKVAEPEEASNE